jgi:aminoglycoside phosphotransferase (APT) family kinase protein
MADLSSFSSFSSGELPCDTRQLEHIFAQLAKRPPIHVHDVLSGNINTIVKVECERQLYGLRVRTQEQVYRYEPDLVKEVFVAELLKLNSQFRTDAGTAALFAELLTAGCGRHDSPGTVLPAVRYYDWTRQILPFPYCVYEWVEGEPLWDTPQPALYRAAGHALTQIHEIQFEAFYADFLSVGTQPVDWAERFPRALSKEVSAAHSRLPQTLGAALATLSIPDTIDVTPCLIHNDFSPGNILVQFENDGKLAAIIDWDNAVIDAPALDFVKMKYWTAKDTSGQLAYDPTLFAAFVEGYGTTGQEIVESLAFALYEVLWLLRVFNFECAKQEQGIARTPGYPEASVYAGFLSEVLARRK